ncbi:MAG TPA: NAD-dependent epimerase/dehydratase family protein [Chloroflexota bacterium]|nr:NAD-dependent epimerase/dehydratase family protein [Chloroflexota bacterium]
MKILVTGGAGFIGSHIVDHLMLAGHQVAIVDNFQTGKRDHINPRATLHEMDLRDDSLADLLRSERPQVVCHQAAQASVSVSVREPVYDAEVNIVAAIRLLEAARAAGVRKIIYASSGGACYGEMANPPVNEDTPVNPMSPYAISKHTVEHYLFAYRQLHGVQYTVLRYANVYGPRQDPRGEAGVIAIFINHMLSGDQPVIYGDGSHERDYVNVTDVARANVAALDQADGEILNIGTGIGTTNNELFEQLKSITGYSGERLHGPPRPGDILRSVIDPSRAAERLGWQPRVSLDAGIRETVDYFRNEATSR